MSTGSDALHAIFSGLVCRSLSNRGPHGMEVDSQTDGLLLNVSLPLPTLPDILLKEMASDETWETYGSRRRRRLVLLRGWRDA